MMHSNNFVFYLVYLSDPLQFINNIPFSFQLGLGNKDKQTRPVFVTELADKDCIALTCGYYHSLALSADRCLWTWGWGVHGQLGFGNIEDYLVPARVTSLDRYGVIRLAAGYSHTAVLTSEVSGQQERCIYCKMSNSTPANYFPSNKVLIQIGKLQQGKMCLYNNYTIDFQQVYNYF